MNDGVTVQHLLRERVAEEVRALLARKMMTGADLAAAIGRSPMYVSRRVRAEVAFDLDDMERMAAVFQVPVSQLMPKLDVADQAEGRPIPRYLDMAERTTASSRPPENRPNGRGLIGAGAGVASAGLGDRGDERAQDRRRRSQAAARDRG